jgi:hypothetical protein
MLNVEQGGQKIKGIAWTNDQKKVPPSVFRPLPLSTDAPRGSRRLAQQDVDIKQITVEHQKNMLANTFSDQ